jgi:hypothetical protein
VTILALPQGPGDEQVVVTVQSLPHGSRWRAHRHAHDWTARRVDQLTAAVEHRTRTVVLSRWLLDAATELLTHVNGV